MIETNSPGKVYRWLYYAILCKGHLKARHRHKKKRRRKEIKEKEVVGWNIYGGDVYESLSSCTPEYMKKEEKKNRAEGKDCGWREKFMSVWSFSVKQRRRIWAIMQNRFVGCVGVWLLIKMGTNSKRKRIWQPKQQQNGGNIFLFA